MGTSHRALWLPSLRRPPDVSARHMANMLDAKAPKKKERRENSERIQREEKRREERREKREERREERRREEKRGEEGREYYIERKKRQTERDEMI
eukprot:Skav208288  [mRNA]  locus=scaffold897:45912:46196:+ [translate_table: standard]